MTQRARWSVLIMLPLIAGLVACSGGSGPEPAASTDAKAKAIQWAQCMRAHGVDMPDPGSGPGGGGQPGTGSGQGAAQAGHETMQKATEACRAYEAGLGADGKVPADKIEQLRAFSRCMRDNGVPDYPDPNPDGTLTLPPAVGQVDGTSGSTTNSALGKALETCSKFSTATASPSAS